MATKRKDVTATRIENLKLLLAQWGGPTVLAKKLRYSGPSYLSQIVGGNRPFTEKTARAIEAALDLPLLWLDREHQVNADIDPELLSSVVARVSAAALESEPMATPRQLSEVISLVYEHSRASGGVDDEYLRRLVKLLSRR